MNDPEITLDRLAAKATELYSLPAVAMKVIELTRNPEVDNRALKECIENDPALTAKLLKVVNSSMFGLSRKVSDLSQALALLGTKPLKLLVLGFSLPTGLCDGMETEVLRRYWRHTLTKAVASRMIHESLHRQPGDEAFLAGLLQDLGILFLIQELGEPYVRFLQKVFAEGRDLAALERDSMGFDHTRLTGRLLAHWNLPPLLVEAVSCEAHDGSADPPSGASQVAHVVRLAELFARFLADGHAKALDELLSAGALHEGAPALAPEQLQPMLDDTQQQVVQLADVLALELPGGLLYEELLAQAHRRLAAVAAEAAEDILSREASTGILDEVAEAFAEESRLLAEAAHKAATVYSSPIHRAGESPSGSRPHECGHYEQPPQARPNAAVCNRPTPATGTVCSSSIHRAGSVDSTSTHPATVTPEPDPGLIGQLGRAVAACRQGRCSLSLILVELGEPAAVILTHGVEGYERLLRLLEQAAAGLDHPRKICLPHGEAGFALVVLGCERQEAVTLAGQLSDNFHRKARQSSPHAPATTVSLGVASVSAPSKNFNPIILLDAADRCLFASRTSGGVVKSIEIY